MEDRLDDGEMKTFLDFLPVVFNMGMKLGQDGIYKDYQKSKEKEDGEPFVLYLSQVCIYDALCAFKLKHPGIYNKMNKRFF
jgi:hypothetical protein